MMIRGCSFLTATIAGLVLMAPAVAEAPSYVGAKKCKMCHVKQYTSWEDTSMAKSFELLKPGVEAEAKKSAGLDPSADYTSDERCLPCHTTGFGQPGGFTSVEATPHLVGVQCESCHGPASAYLAKDKMSLQNKEYKRSDLTAVGLVVPTAETCTGLCHNEKSPFAEAGKAFDFENRKHEGTHEHIPLKFQH